MINRMEMYDFLAIGDTVTDAFIRLKDASVHCDINQEHCTISMRFGDKIPYEEVYVIPAVGNSANAASAAARLGLKTAFLSNIGDDYFGTECLNALKAEGIATDFVTINKGIKTNYHYVLWYEDDRTILVKHEQYPYTLPDINTPRWIYLSSTGEHALDFHTALGAYLLAHPEIKLAFQPGTYQMQFGTEVLRGIYRRTEVFVCNKEEAERILKSDEEDVKVLMQDLAKLGPKIVIITDGPKGAYAFDNSAASATAGKFFFMPSYPDPKPPFERTGAGDAFASTVTIALALGKDLVEALRWGPINSMSVVQQVGARAGLLTRPQLEEYLRNAPKDYGVKEI